MRIDVFPNNPKFGTPHHGPAGAFPRSGEGGEVLLIVFNVINIFSTKRNLGFEGSFYFYPHTNCKILIEIPRRDEWRKKYFFLFEVNEVSIGNFNPRWMLIADILRLEPLSDCLCALVCNLRGELSTEPCSPYQFWSISPKPSLTLVYFGVFIFINHIINI